jgi:hypothetical protein
MYGVGGVAQVVEGLSSKSKALSSNSSAPLPPKRVMLVLYPVVLIL